MLTFSEFHATPLPPLPAQCACFLHKMSHMKRSFQTWRLKQGVLRKLQDSLVTLNFHELTGKYQDKIMGIYKETAFSPLLCFGPSKPSLFRDHLTPLIGLGSHAAYNSQGSFLTGLLLIDLWVSPVLSDSCEKELRAMGEMSMAANVTIKTTSFKLPSEKEAATELNPKNLLNNAGTSVSTGTWTK